MKKLITMVALAIALVSAPAHSQIKFGVKGGLNITDMSLSKEVLETSNRTGFFIGPTMKITLPIVGLGVDASALYDQREAELKNNGSTEKIKQQAINVPINLRYNIGLGSMAGIFFAAGPQFGFNIGDKNQSIFKDAGEWKLKDSNFSVNLGAGVMLLNHLQVGANYNIVCGKTGEVTWTDGTKAFNGRSNSWQISAAYYF